MLKIILFEAKFMGDQNMQYCLFFFTHYNQNFYNYIKYFQNIYTRHASLFNDPLNLTSEVTEWW